MTTSLGIIGNVKIIEDSTTILNNALSIAENHTQSVVNGKAISASAVDVPLNFSSITDATLVILIPNYVTTGTPSKYMTCKVNGGTESIPFGKLLVLGGIGSNGIDSISVSNPDATNVVLLEIYICK